MNTLGRTHLSNEAVEFFVILGHMGPGARFIWSAVLKAETKLGADSVSSRKRVAGI